MYSEPPLATFALLVYNQERFVREAVASALSQTYSPLQIILSDDRSNDRSYQIICELAGNYQGSNKIVVNRTSKNTGSVVAHVNEVMRLAEGELVVIAAGDDISHPDRTDACYRAWLDSGRRSASIWSDYAVIDEDGEFLDGKPSMNISVSGELFEHIQVRPCDVAAWRGPVAFGCSQAWPAKLFRQFGPLPSVPGLVNEDSPIFFRASLLTGRATRIKAPLVFYRRHSANCSQGLAVDGTANTLNWTPDMRVRELKRSKAVAKCFWRDIQRALKVGILGEKEAREIARQVLQSYRSFSLRQQLLGAGNRKRLELVWKLAQLGGSRRIALRELARPLSFTN